MCAAKRAPVSLPLLLLVHAVQQLYRASSASASSRSMQPWNAMHATTMHALRMAALWRSRRARTPCMQCSLCAYAVVMMTDEPQPDH